MTQSGSSQQEENRRAFLRHMGNRIEAVGQRIRRFHREGWEARGMVALRDDVQRLTNACGRYDLFESSQQLRKLEQMLGEQVARNVAPDLQQVERMLAQVAAVAGSLAAPMDEGPPALAGIDPRTSSSGRAPLPADSGSMPPSNPARSSGVVAKANGKIPSRSGTSTSERYVYHLSDRNPLARAIGERFAQAGYEVEDVETVDGLFELLTSLTPHLVLVDSSRIHELAAVGKVRRDARERARRESDGIHVVAMADQDGLQLRLHARRAGVDALLFPPFDPAGIVQRAQNLLTPEAEDMVRVLIVEDDRAQALFAQSVLANAGMQAQVELEPLRVLEALAAFHPDMILMDLHMPEASGVELTALIREQPAFMRTPIVFLTGENDPEARSEAIQAGGDDFLTKPIRPRHLIAAVQNRVRRIRTLQKHELALGTRDVATGLFRRSHVLNCVNDALGASTDQGLEVGGTLFLEIDGTAQLHVRFGIAALEQLVVAAGRVLAAAVGESHVAAQINDDAFLILATDLDDGALHALAGTLRDRLQQHRFEAGGGTVRLRVFVGICPLRFGFDDAVALLDTADRACRDARDRDEGISCFQPVEAVEPDLEAARVAQLREAIRADGIGLMYQPIVAVHGGGQAQYQTFLRLRDAKGRQRPAAEILPLAGRAGLMVDIDRRVLTRVMEVLRRQLDGRSPVRLFVPQAMASFVARDQQIFLKAEMAARKLPGSALVLECSLEDALLDMPALRTFANAMLGDDIRLCLVHYSHGIEAARLLEEIPLGFIKLASKYVAADASRELQDEARMAIDAAHRIGIEVIGHSIEDAHMAATLRTSGIDYIQGHLVQSPMDELDYDFNTAVP